MRVLLLWLPLWAACSNSPAGPPGGDGGSDASASVDCTLPRELLASSFQLRYDLAGYRPEGERWALLLSPGVPAPGYRIYDLGTQCFVAASMAGPRVLDTTSRAGTPLTGDRVELGALAPGRYLLVLDDGTRFGPLSIGEVAYADLVPGVVGFLAVQRCGPTDLATSHHAACHLFSSLAGSPATHSGDGVAVDDGFVGAVGAATGPHVDVEGGWHDAGDYLKFVGTTAFVLAVDLIALRDHRAAFAADAGGRSADALGAELRWGLDWLAKMLGGADLLHQVGGAGDHDAGFRLPEADTATPIAAYDQRPAFRFAAGRGRNLLGRSIAALALGAQVYAADAAYAARLLALARALYPLAQSGRGAPQDPDPPGFYSESSVDDDFALGAAELARATGDPSFAVDARAAALGLSSVGTPIGWAGVDALALLEAARAFPAGSSERAELAARLTSLAAPILATHDAPSGPGAAFHYALPALGDGSLAESLGAAASCLAAHRLGGSDRCVDVARDQLHWLLGRNPFGLSFLVGVGGSNPQNLHHALAQAAHLVLDGALVGGPTAALVLTAAGLPLPPATDRYAAFSTDALLYEDKVDDYVVNEPAIDFTAPLVFVVGELLDPP